jgi:2-dehydropantoate 2-reductase
VAQVYVTEGHGVNTGLRVGVVGAGATGGYLAARLANAGLPVTLMARGASLDLIRSNGIEVFGPGNQRLHGTPQRVVDARDETEPVDLLLFCVKSNDTDKAASDIKSLVDDTSYILCLQNGVENEQILATQYGSERILSGVLYVGVEREAPGKIRCTSEPQIIFGHYRQSGGGEPKKVSDASQAVKNVFDEAGIECTIDNNIMMAKWQKFLFNCGLNPLTALTMQRLDSLLSSDDGIRLFESLVDEAITVAKASKAPIQENAKAKVMKTARTMNISSSMAEDLAAGRPLELNAFTGFIRARGKELGVGTPTTDVIGRLLAVVDPARQNASIR